MNVLYENGQFAGILVTGIVFSTIVLVVYFVMKARTKERLAMIEKGIVEPIKTQNKALKSGLLIVGVGLGIFLGVLISMLFSLDKKVSMAICASLALILGGVGLIISYVIENKNKAN